MESPQRDPTTPGARLPACACPRVRLPEQMGRTERGRYAGRQEDREDSPTHRAGQVARGHLLTLPALPRLPTLPTPPAYPARLPCPPAMLAYPAPFPAIPTCVILSTGAPHAHPAKRPFVKPFYHFPIYQNVTR